MYLNSPFTVAVNAKLTLMIKVYHCLTRYEYFAPHMY